MPNNRTQKVGDEIEGRCTKCKKVTTHTILALQDEEIKKVECIICNGVHRYYPPTKKKPAAKAKKAPAKKAVKTAAGKSKETATSAVLTEWRNAVADAKKDQYKPYMINGVFQESDLITHPKFGKGYVKAIVGTGKMEVLFEDGIRRMVFNLTT